ncbi:MAG: ATP-binding protein [Clostridiales Family XIII bacterium]|nr:ATP-binding protein [Clostridiales Family XIII bacterium]
MMNEETKRKLKEMGFAEAISAAESQDRDAASAGLTFNERFQRVVDFVYREKHNAKVQRLIKAAGFRYRDADMSAVHYGGRGLDRGLIQELATCQYMETHANVIFQGFTGSGKTFLACALGKQTCKLGASARYIRIPDLFMLRDEASLRNQGIHRLLRKLSGYRLLILDEWLLDPMSKDDRNFVFEMIERRHDDASTLYCTQYRKDEWHKRLGGGVHADAIMDRIVHNAIWVDAGGMNMREYAAKQGQA